MVLFRLSKKKKHYARSNLKKKTKRANFVQSYEIVLVQFYEADLVQSYEADLKFLKRGSEEFKVINVFQE